MELYNWLPDEKRAHTPCAVICTKKLAPCRVYEFTLTGESGKVARQLDIKFYVSTPYKIPWELADVETSLLVALAIQAQLATETANALTIEEIAGEQKRKEQMMQTIRS